VVRGTERARIERSGHLSRSPIPAHTHELRIPSNATAGSASVPAGMGSGAVPTNFLLTGRARAVTGLGLPQIRTCPIRASGSSDHGFAARQAEWTIRGLGNGYVRSTRLNHAHDFGWARDRRLSHVFHARWTPCLNSVKDRKFPVMP
jgi:hypothetical protein